MRKIIVITALALITTSLIGCKSIHIGGSGQAGTVSGNGQVTVSIPQEK